MGMRAIFGKVAGMFKRNSKNVEAAIKDGTLIRPTMPKRLFNQQDIIDAKAYFNTLDDSHKVAFRNSNPQLFAAMLTNDEALAQEANRLFSNSAYQTADNKPIDVTVTEPVFVSKK